MSEYLGVVAIIGFVGLVIGSIISAVISQAREKRRMMAMNYAWYRTTHPGCIKGNRVACVDCSAQRVQVRNLMRGTFMREHFCGECGTTLYYSPESNR